MSTFILILITLFCVITCGSVGYIIVDGSYQKVRERRRQKLTNKYLSPLYAWAYSSHIDRNSFSKLINGGSRMVEAEIISRIGLLTYGHINSRMEKLVAWRHIDRMLIRRARIHSGLRRAAYIKTLSQLPLSEKSALTISQFDNDSNRYVRLFALLARINHSPDKLIEIISNYRYALSNLELSQISLLMRRRFVPNSIYTEFLSSYDRNLIILGLYMVRLYRIEAAAPLVSQLIPTPDKALRNTVLHTLITISAPLTQQRTITTVTRMSERGRKRFYRMAADQGYSLQALSPYIKLDQANYLGQYICHSVNGRKRKLHAIQNTNDSI